MFNQHCDHAPRNSIKIPALFGLVCKPDFTPGRTGTLFLILGSQSMKSSPMASFARGSLAITFFGLIGNVPVFAGPVAPSPYLCFDSSAITGCGTSDSPFKAIDFSNGYFHLDNFEDPVTRTPGVTTDGSSTIGLIVPAQRDSVDEDDGVIDGSGNGLVGSLINGQVGIGAQSITFEFDKTVLGELPTHVGVVWTDGAEQTMTTFEAFDPFDVLLGSIGPQHVAGVGLTGQTGEDTFFGWIDTGGISKITISNSDPGIEVDHLQYGNQAVGAPEPVTIALFGLGLLGLGARWRGKKLTSR